MERSSAGSPSRRPSMAGSQELVFSLMLSSSTRSALWSQMMAYYCKYPPTTPEMFLMHPTPPGPWADKKNARLIHWSGIPVTSVTMLWHKDLTGNKRSNRAVTCYGCRPLGCILWLNLATFAGFEAGSNLAGQACRTYPKPDWFLDSERVAGASEVWPLIPKNGADQGKHERRSTTILGAGGASSGQTERGASCLGAGLPSARCADTGIVPAAQAARQPAAKWHQVFFHGGSHGIGKRPFLAGEDDADHKPALAQSQRPPKRPCREE
jgi:hypothetical protein